MRQRPSEPGIGPRFLTLLEGARPIDPATGKPLSDKAWQDRAGGLAGAFRDLRRGSVPSIDKADRLARAIGLTLSELLDGAEPPANPLPSEAELAAMVADVQGELRPGTTLADYPQVVGPALRERLARYQADARSAPYRDRATVREAAAPPPAPTSRAAPAE